MSQQNSPMHELCKKFYGYKTRERYLVIGALLLLVAVVADFLVISPRLDQKKAIQKEMQVLNDQMTELAVTKASVMKSLGSSTLAESGASIANRERLLEQLKNQLRQGTVGLVDPAQMNGLLTTALSKTPGVTLVGISNLEPVPLLEDGEESPDEGKPLVYKHGLVITVEGRYKALSDYLKQLEQSPWQMIWEDVSLERQKYPVIRMQLKVITLSESKEWLGV